MNKPIFLVGFMGSGKTTWGKKIANALEMPFVDLDQEIVQHIGMTIPEYFRQYGEDSFRKLENEYLQKTGRPYRCNLHRRWYTLLFRQYGVD
ncbi:shikimate kinase [Sphingobacterium sp. T2]|uniref:shikimate kinase n=1 Tax=Sphingobacterium sp. T2 TaxID=1590596 RepID=UPI000AA375AC|nr:shikimate kinase [Sphingobacterium sp. T2]